MGGWVAREEHYGITANDKSYELRSKRKIGKNYKGGYEKNTKIIKINQKIIERDSNRDRKTQRYNVFKRNIKS